MSRTGLDKESDAALAGKEELAGLFAQYRAPLYAYFLRRTRNPADAEDLTHDVFIRLARLDRSTEIRDAGAFIFQTAANLLRDRARRARTRGELASLNAPSVEDLPQEITPEHVLTAKAELQAVMAALNALSPRTRHIFVLRRLEAMKYVDIAALYGISVSAVEQHVARALAHLAKTIVRT